MCGIAGYILRHGAADAAVVSRQLELLEHRGPDAVGVFARGRAAIGQTRLSIIDLETGDPPVTSPDGEVGAVLNGELYNYQTLRTALADEGHPFHTSGDTEVLVALAECDSKAMADALEGMFAAAIWDARAERLILLRDRVGKKPLYWWRGPDVVVFASEIKALLAHPAVPAELDERAIPSHLHLGYVPTPATFFRGVESVPPGHVVTIDRDFIPCVRQYWKRPLFAVGKHPAETLTLSGAAEQTLSMLRSSVADRLVSDVPVGAFLSGGLDSAMVVGLMSELSGHRVPTFTMGFEDDDGFDERAAAREVARRFGTDHHEFVVHPDTVALIDDLVTHHDQPFGDSSAIPMWLLAQHAGRHVKVALSGDGGDEVFAGYERMTAALLADAIVRQKGGTFLARGTTAAARLMRRRRPKMARFTTSLHHGLPELYRELSAYAPAALVEELSSGPTSAIDDYDEIWRDSAVAPTLDRILDLNLRTYLLDDLLPKVDRMAMAHALEVRSPLLDHRLIELAAGFPPKLLHRRRGKVVLREAARAVVPRKVLDRPKRGFGVPLTRWFRTDLSDFVRGTLGRGARVRRHVQEQVLDTVVNDHLSARADHHDLIWALLTLETFLQQRQW